jgi:hypothetical protein
MTIHRKTCLGTRQPLTTPQKTVNDSSDFLPSDQLPSIQLPNKIALHFPAPKIMMPTILIPDPYQTSTNLAPQIHLFTASTRSQRHAESSYTRPLPPHIVISHTRLDVPGRRRIADCALVSITRGSHKRQCTRLIVVAEVSCCGGEQTVVL